MPYRRRQARSELENERWAARIRCFVEAVPLLDRPRDINRLLRPRGGQWFTREALAEKAGLPLWRTRCILAARGRQPSLLELLVLSRVIGCTVDALAVALVGVFVRRHYRYLADVLERRRLSGPAGLPIPSLTSACAPDRL